MQVDIVSSEQMEKLERMVKKLVDQNDIIISHLPTNATISVKEIAEKEGVSMRSVQGALAYLLPRYGVSAYPTGKRRWPIQEYLKWREIPVQERIDGFRQYLSNLRATNEQGRGTRRPR